MKKRLCDNVDIHDDMIVIHNNESMTLKEAIKKCEPGHYIEGIHPLQYDKLEKIFEEKRGKKFTYSVDMKYGDWRFILFDFCEKKEHKILYINPICDVIKLSRDIKPIPLDNSNDIK